MFPLLIVVAMLAEAEPIIARLGLVEQARPDPRLPVRLWRGGVRGRAVWLVQPGADAVHEVDNIGTQPAALAAYLGIRAASPRLVLSAGTAGGFARGGAGLGDVFFSEGPVTYHDRRIDLPGFAAYGVGSYPPVALGDVARRLGLKPGALTTGDSLELCDADAAMMARTGGNVKDMEAASVAWVAATMSVPFFGVKAITDLVDGPHPTGEAFLANLRAASARLCASVGALVDALADAAV